MTTLLQPEERVLSTLNADGSRRWLDPKPVKGFFRSRRMVLAWVLIAIFNVLPHLHLDGRQLFFLNIGGGEFTFFGVTFLRTDTLLLALFAITVALSIFLATAVFGRVWCGWACPQTVYLEFLFRPIAGLFDGKSKKGLRGAISVLPKGLRQALRWAVVVFVCFHLSNTFLAYFVGSRTVFEWSLQPPWVHPGGFAFVLFVTAAMVADFGFFREQVCFIACPYGRLQSVLLDRQSLIVGYDYNRGEPRGKFRKNRSDPRPESISLKVVGEGGVATAEPEGFTEPKQGDCVDCNRCVAVCP
ncbi:MAG: 4Fe-4S dicluster domain-containing protein, partial [Planctomycetota bacterium]